MCPPACERARLSTASCCRSSRSWILTSRSRIDGTTASRPTLSSFLLSLAKTAVIQPKNNNRIPAPLTRERLGAQDGQVLRRAGRLPFPRAVLADRARTRVGRRELDQILPGEARVAEAAGLRLGGLVHPVAREISDGVRGDVLRDLLLGVRGRDQLAAQRGVDPVVGGPASRQRADAQGHFARARIPDQLHDLPTGAA